MTHAPVTAGPSDVSPRGTVLEPASPVGVVGFGAMGSGIAQVAAAAGHPVLAYDLLEGAVDRGMGILRAHLERSVEKGRLENEAAQAILNRISPCHSLADLSSAGLVVEAVVEDLESKQLLFGRLEKIVGDHCILATNTSSLSVTALATGLRLPERVVGMHFFNPAPIMPLVEIVSGLATASEVADTAFATARAWGKSPVHSRSTPGFIVNRVARPFYGEALRILVEGGADEATVDAVVRDGGGFRMGPFELLDLIGIDVSLAVGQSVYAALGFDPRFAPSPIQQELVAAGHFGRKTGRGFYEYQEGIEMPAPQTAPRHRPPSQVTAVGDLGIARDLSRAIADAGVSIEHREADGPGYLLVGATRIEPTLGRLATERAAIESTDVVVFDLMLDYSAPGRIAIAAADQASPEAVELAVGLFQATGKEVSVIDDVPGLILMRTVAMLANIACDVVHHGVCDPAAVDTAMSLGVNYPLGPMEWGDLIGPAVLVSVLDNLAAVFGEDRYRASPLLRRRALTGATLRG